MSKAQNVAIEYRWADDKLIVPALAADLVGRRCASLSRAARSGACGQGGDHDYPHRLRHRRRPSRIGLVASLSRPGGNITGVNLFIS